MIAVIHLNVNCSHLEKHNIGWWLRRKPCIVMFPTTMHTINLMSVKCTLEPHSPSNQIKMKGRLALIYPTHGVML